MDFRLAPAREKNKKEIAVLLFRPHGRGLVFGASWRFCRFNQRPQRTKTMKKYHLVAALFAVFTLNSNLQAELITVTGTMTVTADDGDSFKTGDTFTYGFTFNDATIDTDSQTFSAQFKNGVSAFSLTRGVSNTGTWDPASGTFTVSPIANMNVNANGEFVALQATGSGFPDLNGVAFRDVVLSYGFSGVYDFVDTGSGQTFAQMVGVSPLNFALASSQSAQIRDQAFPPAGPTVSASAIPEPSTWAMMAIFAGGAAFAGWRRRNSAKIPA
jgi:hypothetical protein